MHFKLEIKSYNWNLMQTCINPDIIIKLIDSKKTKQSQNILVWIHEKFARKGKALSRLFI